MDEQEAGNAAIRAATHAPGRTRSMHSALHDLGLGLEHLWVIYPGTKSYPLGEKATALPLADLESLDLR